MGARSVPRPLRRTAAPARGLALGRPWEGSGGARSPGPAPSPAASEAALRSRADGHGVGGAPWPWGPSCCLPGGAAPREQFRGLGFTSLGGVSLGLQDEPRLMSCAFEADVQTTPPQGSAGVGSEFGTGGRGRGRRAGAGPEGWGGAGGLGRGRGGSERRQGLRLSAHLRPAWPTSPDWPGLGYTRHSLQTKTRFSSSQEPSLR